MPGLGDLASPAFTALILLESFRRRIPAIVQARMVLNAAIDMVVGLVPVLGDLSDIAFKANLRNVALLDRHARPGVLPRPSDYVFVFVCLVLVGLIALVPIVILVWLLTRFAAV